MRLGVYDCHVMCVSYLASVLPSFFSLPGTRNLYQMDATSGRLCHRRNEDTGLRLSESIGQTLHEQTLTREMHIFTNNASKRSPPCCIAVLSIPHESILPKCSSGIPHGLSDLLQSYPSTISSSENKRNDCTFPFINTLNVPPGYALIKQW